MNAATEAEFLSQLFDELYPICRSITGPGFRESLAILGRYMPLEPGGVPSGSTVFDWTVPDEWRIRSATLTGPDGVVYADLAVNNLHVVNYAAPIDRVLDLAELQPHLYSQPELPEAIPYVTSYYQRNWGFCLPHTVRAALPAGRYHAVIDSAYVAGEVGFAQCVLPGETDQEVLLTSYLCHPSMANNELSGPLVLLALYRRLSQWPKRRFTYRFLLNPETIGSLCFLYRHGEHLRQHMIAGLILTCLGGPKTHLTYKASRQAQSLGDRNARAMARAWPDRLAIRPFTPLSGSDERQYCAPGFNLPVGVMARTIYGEYPEYHSSLDTKASMGIETLVDSTDQIEQYLCRLESAGYFHNLSPFGEPQLGKRGLYPNVNAPGQTDRSNDGLVDGRLFLDRLRWILSDSDGKQAMLAIAERCECDLEDLMPVVARLEAAGLLGFAGATERPL